MQKILSVLLVGAAFAMGSVAVAAKDDAPKAEKKDKKAKKADKADKDAPAKDDAAAPK